MDTSDYAFDTKVIVRQNGNVFSVLRGQDAMNFLADLPHAPDEAQRQAYITRYLNDHLIKTWLTIGNANLFNQQVSLPPLDKHSFHPCTSPEELKEQLRQVNRSPLQAFYLGSLCFVQVAEDGDEWLVIRDYLPFEVICCKNMIERDEFDTWLRRVSTATDAQLRTLKY